MNCITGYRLDNVEAFDKYFDPQMGKDILINCSEGNFNTIYISQIGTHPVSHSPMPTSRHLHGASHWVCVVVATRRSVVPTQVHSKFRVHSRVLVGFLLKSPTLNYASV